MSHLVWRSAPRLLLVSLCAACAASPSTRVSRAVFTSEPSRPDSVVVRVVNQVDRPVTVYRMRDGSSAALGKVSAGSEGRFPLRASEVTSTQMTLAATPVGDRTTVRSAPFRVQRGQVAVFVIAPKLGGSQVFVNWPKR